MVSEFVRANVFVEAVFAQAQRDFDCAHVARFRQHSPHRQYAMWFGVTDTHAVVDDGSHLAVEQLVGSGELFFKGGGDRHQLESRTGLVYVADGAIGKRSGRDLLAKVWIERWAVGERQDFAGVRILHDYCAGDRLRIVNRLVQFFFSDVLNILVDSKNYILAGLWLLLYVGEPLAARIDGDKHLSGAAPQLVVELVFDSALAGIFHPDRADHLRR